MKAAVLQKAPGAIEIEDLPQPLPGDGEVLVKVHACGVCHTDLHVIKAEVAFPTPAVLGHEISGTIVAAGPGVDGVAVGTRMVSAFIMPCGRCRLCAIGRDDLCEKFFAMNRLRGARVYVIGSGVAVAPWKAGNVGRSGSSIGSADGGRPGSSASGTAAAANQCLGIGGTYPKSPGGIQGALSRGARVPPGPRPP